MLEPAGAGISMPRAFLHVAGSTVARHQLALALAFECRRIICIARELAPELVALQHVAEAAGAQFHVILAPRQMVGLITSNDEILALSDGLLAAPQAALEILEGGHSVLVQPVEIGVPLGFERLDLNHASAGAIRIPGRLAERLAELPADVDAVSALTRIALQGGVRQVMVPPESRDGARWMLVKNEVEAHAFESGWIEQIMRQDRTMVPGAALARLGVRAFGPALLHAGSGGNAVAVGAGLTMVFALVAGWFGFFALALGQCGVAWMLRHAGALLAQVERVPPARLPREAMFGWLLDGVVVILVTWSAQLPGWQSAAEIAFAPLTLLCLLRILPRVFDRNWVAWLEDRALLCLLLAIAAAAGLLVEAVEVMAASAALAGALFAGTGARLTRA